MPTVEEAAAALLTNIEEGATCPCCGQFVRAYRRKLRSNHARFLADLIRLSTREEPWVHYTRCFYRGRDYNYLNHFGLAESTTLGRSRTGFWRATAEGVRFILEDGRAPEWILVYNNQVLTRSDKMTTCRELLAGGGFDYDALMGSIGS